MATAKQAGGLYYVNGRAVNADGNIVVGAPSLGPDTVPSIETRPKTLAQEIAEVMAGSVSAQPVAFAEGVPLEDRIADGIARGLAAADAARSAAAETIEKKIDPKDRK